ncbi:alpha/beta hydrolase [Citricoccus sp. NPDC055426]|uniref:alpha/beta fold hydrolase n=1 Tax=Citricoccus sp. NPDC055426 TaxID=3155536 RepID=UPI003422F882
MRGEEQLDAELDAIASHAGKLGVPVPTVRRRRLTSGAGELSALQWGEGEPRLALLHGAGLQARTWNGVLLRLGVPALAIDLPGHGESDRLPVEGYRVGAMGDMVCEALDGAGLTVSTLVGHSLGSFVAARAAVVLGGVGTLAVIDATPHRVGVSDPTRMHAGTLDELVQAMLERMPHRDPRALERALVRDTRLRADGLREWLWDEAFVDAVPLRAAERDSIWRSFEQAATRTFLLRAGRGGLADDEAREFLERVPQASVQVVEDAGHNVHTDRPEWLAGWLRGVLAA